MYLRVFLRVGLLGSVPTCVYICICVCSECPVATGLRSLVLLSLLLQGEALSAPWACCPWGLSVGFLFPKVMWLQPRAGWLCGEPGREPGGQSASPWNYKQTRFLCPMKGSALELVMLWNPVDRGAGQATVHGAVKSRARVRGWAHANLAERAAACAGVRHAGPQTCSQVALPQACAAARDALGLGLVCAAGRPWAKDGQPVFLVSYFGIEGHCLRCYGQDAIRTLITVEAS